MTKLQIFEPAMCCSTGICGPQVDPVLPRFTEDFHWLANQGISVERYNLSQQPQAFVATDPVRVALAAKGTACLPLVVVNGEIVSQGRYPEREELARLAGVSAQLASMAFPVLAGSDCKPNSGCC